MLTIVEVTQQWRSLQSGITSSKDPKYTFSLTKFVKKIKKKKTKTFLLTESCIFTCESCTLILYKEKYEKKRKEKRKTMNEFLCGKTFIFRLSKKTTKTNSRRILPMMFCTSNTVLWKTICLILIYSVFSLRQM